MKEHGTMIVTLKSKITTKKFNDDRTHIPLKLGKPTASITISKKIISKWTIREGEKNGRRVSKMIFQGWPMTKNKTTYLRLFEW